MVESRDIPADIADVLTDPKAYSSERIHDAYSWLRANNPIGLARPEGYDPFWVVTRHADILEISRQNDVFHNGDRNTVLVDKKTDERVREITGGSPHLVLALVQMDPPHHPRYRALTQAWFMPGNVRKLESRIRDIAKETVESMIATGGRCDFVRDVALRYPLHVIMEILGVPREDEPRMLKLTQELFGAQDPETARAAQETDAAAYAEASNAVLQDFYAYFEGLSADRRAQPRDDLASVIANATIDGVPIGGLEQLSYYIIIATAGHDTTSSSLAGGMWQLADNPSEFQKVIHDSTHIPGLVDESIRWTTPVKHFMRTATVDVEFGGRHMKAGDWLMLCYASGNRDETVFSDPLDFRVDRSPNPHIAFGYGAHLCLGQHLAKLEMRIFWEELLPRLRSVELNGPPVLSEATFVNGPKSLPLRFQLA